MSSGHKEMEEEKNFTVEVGRCLHVIKTNEKQRKVIRRAKKRDAQREAVASRPADAKSKRKAPRSMNSGSLWITITPAFRDIGKSAKNEKVAQRAAEWRADQSRKRRDAAFTRAQQYLASAFAQAEEAGLASGRSPVSVEGAAYISEQVAVAAAMLHSVAPRGSHAAALLSSSSPDAVQTLAPMPEKGAHFQQLWDWAMEAIVRERALLSTAAFEEKDEEGNILSTHPTSGLSTLEEPVEDASRSLAASYRFELHEPTESDDVLPCKCILKAKGPGGKKITSMLTSQKMVTNFKQNISQLLKKEILPLLSKSTESPSERGNSSPKSPGSKPVHGKAPANKKTSKK